MRNHRSFGHFWTLSNNSKGFSDHETSKHVRELSSICRWPEFRRLRRLARAASFT